MLPIIARKIYYTNNDNGRGCLVVNYCLFLVHALIFVFVFFVAPAGTHDHTLFFLLPLLAVLSNQHWSLLHECIHGSFFPIRRVNNWAGRCLGVFFCSSFTLVRASHLLHHQVNRTALEQLEICRKEHVSFLSQCGYYYGLFFGLFISEVLGTFLFLLPTPALQYVGKTLFNKENFPSHVFRLIMERKGKLKDTRVDAALILLSLAVSFYWYGTEWWVLGLFLLIRMVLVSFLDYLYHYGTPQGDPTHGYNLWLPSVAAWFLLHFNLHGVHHKNPGVPWRGLPELFKKTDAKYDGNYFLQAKKQLGGLISESKLKKNRA
jgi:fatty acid desaturase